LIQLNKWLRYWRKIISPYIQGHSNLILLLGLYIYSTQMESKFNLLKI